MKKFLLGAVALAAFAVPAAANAAVVFVGSWTVDQGPRWPTRPAALTGQEAAALLFGGSASDYVISTIDNTVANIDHLTWVSTWGGACGGSFPCGTKVAENFKISPTGLYETPGDQSAYVGDWAIGPQFTNYAFKAGNVPEPAAWAMMLAGFGLVGSAMRRREKVAVTFA